MCHVQKGYFHADLENPAVVLSGIVLSQLVDPLSPTSHITLQCFPRRFAELYIHFLNNIFAIFEPKMGCK